MSGLSFCKGTANAETLRPRTSGVVIAKLLFFDMRMRATEKVVCSVANLMPFVVQVPMNRA